MKWDEHFYLFGIGLVILIIAIVFFAQIEGFDFNSFIFGVTNDISEIVENLGLPMELLIVGLLFVGFIVILIAMTKL